MLVAAVITHGDTPMTNRNCHRLLQACCALIALLVIASPAAVADELPANDGGHGIDSTSCTQLYQDADVAVDTFEALLLTDAGLAETDIVGPVQAITADLNFRATSMGCPATSKDY